jgi:hypothetical protein
MLVPPARAAFSHLLAALFMFAATFLQGPPPPESWGSSSSSSSSADAISLSYMRSSDERKPGHRMVAGGNGRLQYEAKNFGDDASKGTYKYAVGVLNRKRKRMDVYEADANGYVFGVHLTSVDGADTGAMASVLEGVTVKARRDMLIDAFGSRKKKAMERSKQANIVDVSAVAAAEDVAASLKASSSLAAMNDADGEDQAGDAPAGRSARAVEATLRESRLTMLPPYNERAATPADVYPLDGILGSAASATEVTVNNIIRSLRDSVKLHALINSIARDSDFLRDRLSSVTAARFSGDDGSGGTVNAAMRRKLHSLVFLKHLLSLHRTKGELRHKLITAKPEREGEDGPAADSAEATAASTDTGTVIAIPALKHIPSAVVDRMLSLFAEQRHGGSSRGSAAQASSGDAAAQLADQPSYVRTKQLEDKLVTWIACLSLVIDDFNSDIRLLAADLKITPARALHFFKELGCSATPVRGAAAASSTAADGADDIKRAIVSYQVKLTVPLTFPKIKLGRKQ